MNASLETEILAALEQADIHLNSFLRISHFRKNETGRVTYRIDHERGTVKARLLENEPTARHLAVLRSELGDAFAPVLHRCGRVLIEEWIEGDTIPDRPEPPHLAAAGTLLGGMHARRVIARRSLHEIQATAPHRLAAEKSIGVAVAAGALEERVAARLGQALQRSDPLQTTHGLVHLDFCGDNMVIDRTGRLRVVDNERVCLDSLGYDLGRTWYRWALRGREWDLFCGAYASQLPFPDSLESLHFWKIVAAAGSAALRLRAYPEKADVPLRCLRALAGEGPYEAG